MMFATLWRKYFHARAPASLLFHAPEALLTVRDTVDRKIEIEQESMGPSKRALVLIGNVAVACSGTKLLETGPSEPIGSTPIQIMQQQQQIAAEAAEQMRQVDAQRAAHKDWEQKR